MRQPRRRLPHQTKPEVAHVPLPCHFEGSHSCRTINTLPPHNGLLRFLQVMSCELMMIYVVIRWICMNDGFGETMYLVQQAMPNFFGNCVCLHKRQLRVDLNVQSNMERVTYPTSTRIGDRLDPRHLLCRRKHSRDNVRVHSI